MRVLLIVALCLASVMSAPSFKNPAGCGKVATNGRCGRYGANGTRCAWGYCSPWSWCGVGAAYTQRGCQPQYHHKAGCYTDSHWNTEKTKWEAAQAKKAEAARKAALLKAQAAAAAKAKAAAAAKKAHDAAKAAAAKKAAEAAARKAKHDAMILAQKRAAAALLARIAAAKKAAAAQQLKAQKAAAAAAAKAAAHAKSLAEAKKRAQAAAAAAARTAAINAQRHMVLAIRKDEIKYEKRPAFRNPAKCGKLGVSSNGRCGSAGAGGPKCAWGQCSQWLWCGTTPAHKGPHHEWWATPGCKTAAYWKTQLTAWTKQAKLYGQWMTGWKSGLRSINSKRKFKLTIMNNTDQPMECVWVNYQGKLVRYVTLQDGQKWAVWSYDTHPWVFRDPKFHISYGIFTGKNAVADTTLEIFTNKIVAH